MLTPNFNLSQTEREICLVIRAPLANIAKTELVVNRNLIFFYSSPYYLRLHLPGELVDDENQTGKYDSDKGEFTFILKKMDENQHFEDLDLIGKLLAPTKKHQARPDIQMCEVVQSSDPESCSEDGEDWYLEQEILEEDSFDLPKYGFANKTQGMGRELRMEFYEVLDLKEVEKTPTNERCLLREAEEQMKFSEEHYMADMMEPQGLGELLDYDPPWENNILIKKEVVLTDEEREYLKTLGNKDYLIDSKERRIALLSLVDILYAYAYNHRTTLGESTVESAWTINKLSSTLSWLQSFECMKDVKVACIRRSLIYPLHRNWILSTTVMEDTLNILKLGRRQILKCLIEIHKLFNASEPRYLLNQLFITDYCIWLQKISEKRIIHLMQYFKEAKLCKNDIRLDLETLEAVALMVEKEELDRMTHQMTMKIDNITVGSDDTEDSELDSDTTTSSSSCSSCEESSAEEEDESESD
ncbi:protein SHQ1 homolog isoform X1 [Rhodnius prolixus]|uniref:Protein SHQ1 homolog n=2 Tax=Rhodnius prolixus TaxID=13249 RepID=A0A4P6D6A4_RHOPR